MNIPNKNTRKNIHNYTCKKKHRHVKQSITKKKSRAKKGGEAIGSGGFGCIFKPALKCKDTHKRTNGVSKMSITKYSKQEIHEITRIKRRLHKIKNYEHYFLLDADICEPDKLTQQDMTAFNKKCFALTKQNLNEKNINSNLDKVSIINMPDGGMDLKKWLIHDDKITRDKIYLLNNAIIKLLVHGIKPMNKAGVIHHDLKDRNILIDKFADARIIDWGLSGIVVNHSIPLEIRNRPLQFNTPFSSMILSDEFKLNYNLFLDRVKSGDVLFNKVNVRNYIINEYLIKLARYYGYYDDNVILFKMIFSPAISQETFLSEVKRDNLIEYGYYLYYLSNYITDILMKYTNNKLEMNYDKYFMECYLFNSDVFGLMTVYYNYFESNIKFIDFDEEKRRIYLNRVRSILVEHIYSNGASKINIHKLTQAIRELNDIVNYDKTLSVMSGKKALYSEFSIYESDSKTNNLSKSKTKSKSKSRSNSPFKFQN
jgi:serine/threonine protein kinase